LHGAGGYGRDGVGQITEGLAPAIMRHPERFPAIAVFPQIARDGASGWQGKGARIAMAALGAAIAEFNGDESRIVLTGLSMGGNGAWYLAYQNAQRFAGLLVICGFVEERQGSVYPIFYPSLEPGAVNPSAAVASRLAHIPIWIIHGDVDLVVPVEHSRRMAAALLAKAAPALYTELAGVGHNAWDVTYDRPDVASWLLSQRLTAPVS
jgi:predicted peptidase